MARIRPPGQRRSFWRLLKYASVSAISTATSFTILGILVGAAGMAAVWANLIAVALGTIPSFELNRRWVWACSGERPRLAQVLPFCLLAFSGLVVSSIAVHVAGVLTAAESRLTHTAAVEAGNLGSYGALWVIQFVLCDRVLFRSRATSDPVVCGAVVEAEPVPEDTALVGVGSRAGDAEGKASASQHSPSWLARHGQPRPLH